MLTLALMYDRSGVAKNCQKMLPLLNVPFSTMFTSDIGTMDSAIDADALLVPVE